MRVFWWTLDFDFVRKGAKFKFKILDSYEYIFDFGNINLYYIVGINLHYSVGMNLNYIIGMQ